MSDLYVAYTAMFVLSAVAGYSAAKWCYPASRQTLVLLLTLMLVATFFYMSQVAGQLYLARFVPLSAAIIWTNITPVLAALAAGWLLRLTEVPQPRRGILCGVLCIGAIGSLFWPSLGPLLRPPPVGEGLYVDGIVKQSHWATCSPAAAATLLNQVGIQTTESEMIPLCLTDRSGTPSLGLYRGVKLMTARASRDVQFVHGNIEMLLNNKQWPLLLTVQLPAYEVEDPRYEQEWGWIPGMGHSVVALGRDPQGVVIADPAVGLEVWSDEDLRVLWHGEALQVTRAESLELSN